MSEATDGESWLRIILRWTIYPFSWACLIFMFFMIRSEELDPRQGWGIFVAGMAGFYIVAERLVPYEKRWSMTWQSFFSDMKYLAINGSTLAATSAILGIFAITTAGQLTGPAEDWPFLLQVVVMILIFEAIQYSIHRIQHEMGGAFGNFLWRTHAAHHLPERLYVVMHVAGHPINAIVTQGLAIIVPIWLMGYDQLAVTTFLMINSLHGLISHFNVDVRIGWMNYVFVGPELHRYHHSADIDEAKNYGATTPLFDLVFGTFVYRPARPPQNLGVADENYPSYDNFFDVMRLPFRRPS